MKRSDSDFFALHAYVRLLYFFFVFASIIRLLFSKALSSAFCIYPAFPMLVMPIVVPMIPNRPAPQDRQC